MSYMTSADHVSVILVLLAQWATVNYLRRTPPILLHLLEAQNKHCPGLLAFFLHTLIRRYRTSDDLFNSVVPGSRVLCPYVFHLSLQSCCFCREPLHDQSLAVGGIACDLAPLGNWFEGTGCSYCFPHVVRRVSYGPPEWSGKRWEAPGFDRSLS